MVPTTRTPVRAGSLKFLNAPRPVSLRLSNTAEPAAVDMAMPLKTGQRGRPAIKAEWVKVRSVDDTWKVGPDEWWRGPAHTIERMYYELRLEDGRRLTVFQDMVNDGWFRQEDV